MLQTGLYSRYTKNMVLGLPSDIINGKIAQIKSAWRGAFLANGRLSDPGKASYLEIVCPNHEAALALVSTARRLGITAKPRKLRSSERVTLRDPDAIERMLILYGCAALRTRVDRKAFRRRSSGQSQPSGQLRRRQHASQRQGGCGSMRQGSSGVLRFLEMTFQTTSNRPASFVSTMLMRRWNSWDVWPIHQSPRMPSRAVSVDFCSSPRKPKKRAASRLD